MTAGRELHAELLGTKCRCGRAKRSKQTFCFACYSALPLKTQRALYRRMGEGYEEAYAEAVGKLRGDNPHGEDA